MASEVLVNDPRARAKLSQCLRSWYRQHARKLPWRDTTDPYAILVSEVMLHQTQVNTVLRYFERFMRKFPTVHSLAEASLEDVMKLWAGLGYYRRAKLLHAAAQKICAEFRGKVPPSIADLQQIPGIGRYTAGAIASFAFGVRAPIVEANSMRVLQRVFARQLASEITRESRLWDLAELLLPVRNVREHNYAIMELGSLVCSPHEPNCEECQIRLWCDAYEFGRPAEIGRGNLRLPKVDVHFITLAYLAGQDLLLRRIPEGEWHAGTYGLPMVRVEFPSHGVADEQWVCSFVHGVKPYSLQHIGCFRYSVTRHRVFSHLWLIRLSLPCAPSVLLNEEEASAFWIPLPNVTNLPLGSPHRRMVENVVRVTAEEKSNGRGQETLDS
ncbi:MAG: A/G-specific adenine glycosylase [Candidatus Hydrogenedentota bacterium]|uniref:Adenine DNA glycosylase n=1 Tax=Sumerlaea chitinivorans TaxID=2250252 RepID=A0A2Z4Y381_SUMC1|nr:A/G-specific adenine glycosylase [Candidatus Sumerlaea chitinivorans]RMH27593.1 MAG: A/G-specific adenine glycosylase [Candidatus Hydrogenedentota bacterium]